MPEPSTVVALSLPLENMYQQLKQYDQKLPIEDGHHHKTLLSQFQLEQFFRIILIPATFFLDVIPWRISSSDQQRGTSLITPYVSMKFRGMKAFIRSSFNSLFSTNLYAACMSMKDSLYSVMPIEYTFLFAQVPLI